MDAELTIRFNETSLDPYVRFFEPRLSPFTNAVAGGTIRVVGELTDPRSHRRRGSSRAARPQALRLPSAQRGADRADARPGRRASRSAEALWRGDRAPGRRVTPRSTRTRCRSKRQGDANLGILQGFFRDIRSRGTAALKAQISGTLDKPVFSGSASIADGRLRYMSVPHALEAINGRITFDAGGVRIDDVAARLGEGDVHFGGRIGLNGFAPGDIT